MTKWLDDLHEGKRIVSDVESELYAYSRALQVAGNTRLSDDLFSLALNLNDARRLLKSGTDEALDKIYKGAMQSTGNMLEAVLHIWEQGGGL